MKLLSAAWGTATEKWVGKSATVTILPAGNGKDMVICKPASGKVAADGSQVEGVYTEGEDVPF